MKILVSNKTYNACINSSNPCKTCIVDGKTCAKIPAEFCIKYGGFLQSDTKIFTL